MTLDKLRSMDKDDFLHMLGLQRERSAVDYIAPTLALFGIGLLVGTGLGLLIAPRPGRELRQDLANRIQQQVPRAARIGAQATQATADTVAGRTSTFTPENGV